MQKKMLDRMFCKILVGTLLTLCIGVTGSTCLAEGFQNKEYGFWKTIGKMAALNAIKEIGPKKNFKKDFIALSNAGYAEINGRTTQATLDGLSDELNVSRGNFSLVEVHSNSFAPLWFAVYHKPTGICVYLEVAPEAVTDLIELNPQSKGKLFSAVTKTVITAEKIYENPSESAAIFDNLIFNGNEFRIVTIVNGILAGAPPYAVRSMELHDHYCPGVMSGIFLAQYLKKEFPLSQGGSYFVQSVQPWCKEDALISILNATPGKKSYHLYYPTEEDKSRWIDGAKDAANIIYRNDPINNTWDGIVVGIQFGETGCPSYNHTLLDKLCSDLYYLKHLNTPQEYISVIKSFTLPSDITPQSYARPGVDPMEQLGLVTTK
jgi:formylmethanofuran dehydrogenase subunit E-like metal-binding protein